MNKKIFKIIIQFKKLHENSQRYLDKTQCRKTQFGPILDHHVFELHSERPNYSVINLLENKISRESSLSVWNGNLFKISENSVRTSSVLQLTGSINRKWNEITLIHLKHLKLYVDEEKLDRDVKGNFITHKKFIQSNRLWII